MCFLLPLAASSSWCLLGVEVGVEASVLVWLARRPEDRTRMYGEDPTEELVGTKICIQPQVRQSCVRGTFCIQKISIHLPAKITTLPPSSGYPSVRLYVVATATAIPRTAQPQP